MKVLKIQWAAPAETGLDRILTFIATENPQAARKRWALAKDPVAAAARHPERAPAIPERGRTCREILAVRPFRIITSVEEQTRRVLAVLRQEQDFDPGRFLA